MRRLSWALAALLLAATLAMVWLARHALPQADGELRLPGAQGEIRIERDVQGIPTIRAGSEHDALFGLGVVHAQDRLWQMETHRRIGAGRLAEVFGPAALDNDRFLRALQVRRAAQAQWQRLSPTSRAAVQAYADGVNAVLRSGTQGRPPEALVLGIVPEPWDPVDSVAWALMMAWDLGGNWNLELLRLRLALQMPVDRVNQVLPPYPGDAPVDTADYAALYRGLKLDGGTTTAWSELPRLGPETGVEGVGSNNWVLAGSRTATGRPLLANDPHLRLGTPALWYLARLEYPGHAIAGATLPGLPGVLLGQNRHIAWGYTNTNPDVQDLYLEEVQSDDPARYRTPEGWAAFESTTEVIRVRGKPAVTMTVRRTRHGPVISDAGPAAAVQAGAARPTHVLALRWTALDPDLDPIGPQQRLSQATSVADFIAATRGWGAPMQSMVVADVDGHIGLVAPGRVPVRRADNDLKGLVPAPGWDLRYDWAGWVPVDETPRETDPPRGWIATANQRITAPGYPHHLTSDWSPPVRQQRIEQVLQSRPRHTLADLAALQADVQSLAVPRLLPWLRSAVSAHPLAPAAQRMLATFDGRMDAGSPAPLIYWAWQRQLAAAVFADDVSPALWERSLAGRNFQEALDGVLHRDDGSWCDDRRTAGVMETCAQQAGAALTRALDELQARHGVDVTAWRWGDAHRLRAEHRPFSRVPVLWRWFELQAPLGGDTHTANVSRVSLRPDPMNGELYQSDHGPGLRALYDLGDPSQSRVMQSSGQSGIVYSPLYRSFLEPWVRVEYVPLWPQQGQAPARVLLVKPAPVR